MHVRIPTSARLSYAPQVTDNYRIEVPMALDPEWGRNGAVAAVDIGTTTVSVVRLDLANGEASEAASQFNQQIALGEDVLTRISLCRNDPTALSQLEDAIWQETLWPLWSELDEADPIAWVLSGNTTMLHLALGVDPGPMGVAPFPAPFLGSQLRQPRGSRGAPVRTVPNGSAYIGGDIIAGMVATGFIYEEGPALFVDIGTNGEIVFIDQGRMVGTATAAGPAFEGSGLRCGVRAGVGAISKVHRASSGLEFETIGEAEPIGICGSGYVDFLAEALEADVVSPTGRLMQGTPDDNPHEGRFFQLGRGRGKRPIGVTERDIARLIQAKAAIGAGIETLMGSLGIHPRELRRLYLAGGFGMNLNLSHAVACGLLPGFDPDQVRLVGNSSLAGAHLAALDQGALAEMTRTAEQLEVVELNLQPGFEDTYLDHLTLTQPL